MEHLHAVIAQLLAAEAVSDIPTWLPVVVRLATEAARSLSPSAISARSVLDPRYYVHVKKVVDAQPPSASGVVQVRTRPACMCVLFLTWSTGKPLVCLSTGAQMQHKWPQRSGLEYVFIMNVTQRAIRSRLLSEHYLLIDIDKPSVVLQLALQGGGVQQERDAPLRARRHSTHLSIDDKQWALCSGWCPARTRCGRRKRLQRPCSVHHLSTDSSACIRS